MFRLFSKKTPENIQPTHEVDFDEVVATLSVMTKAAQMTFLYRYVKTLSPNMCRTLLTYTHVQLKSFDTKEVTP